ncbi:hypothetical protein J2810_002529 [Chryseobacterium rhizosphaerae]|uniref:T6SS immunity protein Tdi1 domain-containing protein n=1 Tax=Chryseobacterium rhizosphaerae TaxID=395937 RepID=UPI00285AEB06|nr:T6SS immunity protein Tdi1 domain-containing protein [Chryseobacterium rhizosphaerae]MDR6546470.1 hypothetical protein [Chryseobacterium rhizosphaerae]
MFEKFIEEYGNIEHKVELSKDHLEQVKGFLPEELFSFIANGTGSYMDGFFWVVDPIEFDSILKEIYVPVHEPSICFARDAFGGLYSYEGESVIYINIRHSVSKVIGRKVNVLFNSIMTDWEYFSEELLLDNYEPAKERLGKVEADECYGYVPLLGLGGPEKVENLQKVKLREHISIVAQALGKIE